MSLERGRDIRHAPPPALTARVRKPTCESLMEIPDPEYVKTEDGAYIAYLVLGDGPVEPCVRLRTELVQQPRRASNVGKQERDRAGREIASHAT